MTQVLHRLSRRHAYVGVVLSLCVLDLITWSLQGFSLLGAGVDAALVLSAWNLPRHPYSAGSALLAIYVAASAPVSLVSYGCFAGFLVCVEWTARGAFRRCAAASGLVLAESLLVSDTPAAAFSATLMFLMFSVGTGLLMHFYRGQLQAAQLREALLTERLRTEREATASAIALQLHDTLATDLSKTLLRARLLRNADATGEAVDALIEGTDDALTSVRLVMHTLGAGPSAHTKRLAPWTDAVDEARALLRSHGFRLSVHGEDTDLLLPQEQHELAVLFLREGTVNILKYAEPRSEVRLTRQSEGTLLLTLESQLRKNPADTEERADTSGLSGGFGLRGLRQRASDLGGMLDAGPVNGRWRAVLALPVDPEEEDADELP